MGNPRWRKESKILTLTHYGNGKCACVRCGVDNVDCLSIDHINGKGELERREVKVKGGHPFYDWLIKNNFPSGYQTLCMNCQFIKRAENNEYASKYRRALQQLEEGLETIKQLMLDI